MKITKTKKASVEILPGHSAIRGCVHQRVSLCYEICPPYGDMQDTIPSDTKSGYPHKIAMGNALQQLAAFLSCTNSAIETRLEQAYAAFPFCLDTRLVSHEIALGMSLIRHIV